jgi:hypothetical protein
MFEGHSITLRMNITASWQWCNQLASQMSTATSVLCENMPFDRVYPVDFA